MYPDLFGIPDFSYILLEVIGFIAAFALLIIYLKKIRTSKTGILEVLMIGCFAITGGIIGAILTQNLYELIDHPSTYHWVWSMTFYGGLFFGAGVFILVYFLLKNKHFDIRDILIVAPACITIAHAFGRIGCLLAGCCYGLEVTTGFGLPCSSSDDKLHIPTQLYESIFLFILSGALFVPAFLKKFKYGFPIYMAAYGIWRFIIEFYRADHRGSFVGNLSPSQFWCIVLVILAIPTYFLFKFIIFKERTLQNEQK